MLGSVHSCSSEVTLDLLLLWFLRDSLLQPEDANLFFPPHVISLFLFPPQLPRAIPWEKKLFLRPWEKSSYFRKTRHCFELQPRNSPFFPSSSFSFSLCTCCTAQQCLPSIHRHVASNSAHISQSSGLNCSLCVCVCVCVCVFPCTVQAERRHDGSCRSCTTCGAARRRRWRRQRGLVLKRRRRDTAALLHVCDMWMTAGCVEPRGPESQVFIQQPIMHVVFLFLHENRMFLLHIHR